MCNQTPAWSATKKLVLLLILNCLPLLCGCGPCQYLPENNTLYRVDPGSFQDNIFSPAFLVYNSQESYNRIGTPAVRQTEGGESEIFVDAAAPTVFFEHNDFSTPRGAYHNLIYRIHFEKVPLGIGKIHLTAGNNPGILIIFTLDQQESLLLITTVHTCGCFLAFFPTDKMDRALYPAGHPDRTQWIYGHTLPGGISLSFLQAPLNIVFALESETHRISNVTVYDRIPPPNFNHIETMITAPMKALYHLPSGGGTESFFEMSGPGEGYVKNNVKILERLFMSWWAFDWRVGQDKAYGKNDKSSIPLYTSLKFWARQESDLKNFPHFLAYWGWKL